MVEIGLVAVGICCCNPCLRKLTSFHSIETEIDPVERSGQIYIDRMLGRR